MIIISAPKYTWLTAVVATAAASPASFGRATMGEMFERTRELDRTIDDPLLAGDEDEQDPLQAEWMAPVDRIIRTATRDLTGLRCKVRLAAEALDTPVISTEALPDSVEADLNALDRSGLG